jgi:DNA topoisomerase IA
MARKILCVAEKPSIAKAVAGHLGGGAVETVSSISWTKARDRTQFAPEASERKPVYKKL